ncbi:MAG TPA: hypothetical protein VFV46_11790 [Lacibacter sp.]|nr:hypothetical protein [Lacibacter sp.]
MGKATAQQKNIVWQGKMRLQGGAAKELSLRLELVNEGMQCIGVLYTRGADKGSVFGCDYIVAGIYLNNLFDLKQVKVIRSVAIRSTECDQFEKIAVSTPAPDSFRNVSGRWVWKSGESIELKLVKMDETISDQSIDEFTTYREELFKTYEEKSVVLLPAERWGQMIFQTEVDSTDLVVDIAGTEAGSSDSIQVFLNGDAVTNSYPLASGQLRLRIKAMSKGANELTVVNTSAITSKLFFSIGFTQHGKTKTSGGEATFARNAVFVLKRTD